MITYNDMMEAQNALVADWGEAGKKVVLACWVNRHSMPMKEFLTYCTCCGGNWGGMLLTGIKALSKEVALSNWRPIQKILALLNC